MFLVRAVNKDGDSPDLTTKDFTCIKLPYEVPTQVGHMIDLPAIGNSFKCELLASADM